MIRYEISDTPPTVNTMYRNLRGKGRVKTGRYISWSKKAEYEIRKQGMDKIRSAQYGLIILIKKRANGDLSNYIKPIEDMLVRLGITPDDQFNIMPLALPRHEGKGASIICLEKEEAKAISQNILEFIE